VSSKRGKVFKGIRFFTIINGLDVFGTIHAYYMDRLPFCPCSFLVFKDSDKGNRFFNGRNNIQPVFV